MTDRRLGDLIAAAPGATLQNGEAAREIAVSHITHDSRLVTPGTLFLCIPGARYDGAAFLADAVSAGAIAAVVERQPEAGSPVPLVHVPSVRAAAGPLAAAFYEYPSRRIRLAGVTGTNGKTTTTYLIEHLARCMGFHTGVLGTVNTRIGDVVLPSEHTTPEATDIQQLLDRIARGAGSESAVVAMEVSSHALDMRRTDGSEFDVVIFTNLTQDHLDYHQDMESYFSSKQRLFTEYPRSTQKPVQAVINIDDPYGQRLRESASCPVISYSAERDADLQAADIAAEPEGLRFVLQIRGEPFVCRPPLGGLFNVYNSLAAAGAALAMGWPAEEIARGLSTAMGAPGRFERVRVEGLRPGFDVIVDYAHSPAGLENLLQSARALNPARIITLFGCGGDRDRGKRPLMGGIAARYSDLLFVTSDNPRTEDPEAIIDEILTGISSNLTQVRRISDRRAAIREAIEEARPGDLVLIAGKGHEDYQIIGTQKFEFDDRKEAVEAIRSRLDS